MIKRKCNESTGLKYQRKPDAFRPFLQHATENQKYQLFDATASSKVHSYWAFLPKCLLVRVGLMEMANCTFQSMPPKPIFRMLVYLIANDSIVDDDVGYFVAGHVAGYIPKILHWINYAGLPLAGKWGEVLGDGDSETGCELCVEKFSSHSIMYQHLGQAYIQLGNQFFEIRGGCIENSANPILLEQAKPINGCWEVI